MTEPIKIHIIETEEFGKRITDLGHMVNYIDLKFGENSIQGFKDPREPRDVYVLKSSVEWILSV